VFPLAEKSIVKLVIIVQKIITAKMILNIAVEQDRLTPQKQVVTHARQELLIVEAHAKNVVADILIPAELLA